MSPGIQETCPACFTGPQVIAPLGTHAAELCPHKLRVRPAEGTDPTNPKDAIASRKPASFSVVPTVSLQTEAQAMEWGAFKAGDKGTGYGPFNWRQTPVRLSVYLDAMMRHFIAFIDGEEVASDSKVHHLGHLKAGCGIVLDAAKHGTLIDDRPGKCATRPLVSGDSTGPEETVTEREIAKARRVQQNTRCCSPEVPSISSVHDGVAKELDRRPSHPYRWEDIKRRLPTWPCPYCSSEMIGEDSYVQHLKYAHKKTVRS